ncbi:MAG TPA: NifB/NifX family molybdenum-iron cluster-binding protein [Desulfosalsimonadaceae bacterium]|nr:NifB/NifX family molybdenum-iron cluster-binding protein [Desulfosalsimonadaceae bacterium]
MKIAIPQWQGRVSPVFDAASSLLLVDIENGRQAGRVALKMNPEDPLSRARRLAILGVDILICGAVSSALAAAIVSVDIEILACTCGPIDGVLDAFLENRLSNSRFLMPGCSKRRRYFHD